MRWILAAVALIVLSPVGMALAAAPAAVVETADAKQIAKLIEQLGSDDYFVRERAQESLAAIGLEAFDALSEAENHTDIEVAERVRYLLRLVRVQWIRPADPPVVKQLLDTYGSGNDEVRQEIIDKLAALPLPHGVSVPCRLVRFEKSNLLSRLAALAVIERQPVDDAEKSQRQELIGQSLGSSPRSSADWLRAYAARQRDPAGAVATWNKLLDDEVQTYEQFPNQTSASVVFRLLKQHVALLEQLGRNDDALAAMQRTLLFEPENDDGLAQVLTWLVERKAWGVVDAATKQFEERFAQDPMLLYVLADACKAQGNTELANVNAKRALGLNAGNQFQHLAVGFKLQIKGLVDWSADEYRLSIKLGQPGSHNTFKAQQFLSDMLHDHGDDEEAAKTMEEGVTSTEAAINAGRQVDDLSRELRTGKARMNYYFACAAERKKEFDKQATHLKAALLNDPTDADVLIGLFRHPKLADADKAKVRQDIRNAAELFRRQIQESPEEAMAYNQLAWLIANTEGDFKEAVRCSEKSLELRPNAPEYLDTLGRCYFAVKDIDKAIKHQTQAVTLMPHSGLMKRQLEEFKAAKAKRNDKS